MDNLNDTDTYKKHYSVLKKECLEFLLPPELLEQKREIFLADMTFGAGGHSLAMLKSAPNIHLISIDQDPDALANGKKRISELTEDERGRIELWDMNFESFSEQVRLRRPDIFNEGGGLDGILMDLGVSSHQFDEGERGFSFRQDAPLDMRMNYGDSDTPTAADLVNSMDEEELADIFFNYGEEKFSRKIARNIVTHRAKEKIVTTGDLENIIFHSYPPQMRHARLHPATRCFQALRIAVNRELEVLEKAVPDLFNVLRPGGGRLAVISFHSLEDRIVKHGMKKLEGEILTKKPIIPSEEEIEENSRSRSAKLRVIQR